MLDHLVFCNLSACFIFYVLWSQFYPANPAIPTIQSIKKCLHVVNWNFREETPIFDHKVVILWGTNRPCDNNFVKTAWLARQFSFPIAVKQRKNLGCLAFWQYIHIQPKCPVINRKWFIALSVKTCNFPE